MKTPKELVYQAWAPRGGVWADWAKPVLFACMDPAPPAPVQWEIPSAADWLPPVAEHAAVVLDLPGDRAVRFGLAAARRGYHPVPLFNAMPFPFASAAEVQTYYAEKKFSAALVDVIPILSALWHGADELGRLAIPNDAPPAFLLDANRSGGRDDAKPGRFDNRSITFTTDFPSANFLQSKHIHKVVLVQPSGDQPQADLAHTLRRWQEGGLRIELKRLDEPGAARLCDVARPSRFGRFWQRMSAGFRLRSHQLGGYGGTIPELWASGSGG